MAYISLKANQYAAAFRVPAEDLVQEACIAVLQSEKTFDPTRGKSFFGYAARYIKWRMLRYCKYTANDIRVTEQKFEEIRFDMLSLDAPIGESDEETHDVIGLPENVTPLLDHQDRAALLTAALARLKTREREILRLRFIEDKTLAETADHFGVSKQAISERCKTILTKLRRSALLKEAA
jgi:RNA polymerase sigma factor (sigma-70 family)